MIIANSNDKSTVVDILCQSFKENNSVNYVVKQDKKREKRIKTLMEYSFELCLRYGKVYLSDEKNACALTLFPDRQRTNFHTIKLDLKLIFQCIGLLNMAKVLSRNSKIKSNYPKHPIIYLWFIGVNPTDQNRGLGSKLLIDIIKDSESTQKPIYLETSMPENLPFYKKFGFTVYNELNFTHKLYLLRRE